MHIHKPKVVHGLREFLSEIGVIVLGIAIALGGEQAIEWAHWRHVVAGTREALNHELAFDLGVVQARVDQAPCMARRLTELDTVFERHMIGAPLALKRSFGQPSTPHIRTTVWETAIADQSASHMPLDLKLRYAGVYEAVYWLRDRSGEELAAWTHLNQIDDQQVMTEVDWAALRQWKAYAQAQAQRVDDVVLPFSERGASHEVFLDRAAGLGIKPEAFRLTGAAQARLQTRLANFCSPLL
ncbi:MAG TPA: hypothetical protein VG248_07530 [Caulobacteraceae bacterium]|jgi:hypothetical protein|nr:hypothetical protein [Caulobacteraceae bacterium]